MSGPYEFGDVVDGYRWTVLGWEPVEGSEPAASAALQHALDTHLEQPALTRHARHIFSAVHPPAAQTARATPGDLAPDDLAPDDLAPHDPADPATPGSPPAEVAGDVAAEPLPEPTADSGDLLVPSARGTDPAAAAADPVADAPTTPQLRWTPVGWEVVADESLEAEPAGATDVEPTASTGDGDELPARSAAGGEAGPEAEPVEEFADVIAAAPSTPPLEAEDDDPGVIDLRTTERTAALPEPTAGWYPG